MPSGWLHLEALKRKEWTQRFFVLDEGYLRYFVTDEDLDPVATINVRGIEAKAVGQARAGKYAFRLNVTKQEDGRYKYVLAGDTEAESKQWLKWLAEEGVSVPNLKLTSKKVAVEESAIGRLLSFKKPDSSKSAPDSSKSRDGSGTSDGGGAGTNRLMSFLSFGGKKKAAKAPSLGVDDQSSSASVGQTRSGKHVSIAEPNTPSAERGAVSPKSPLVRQMSSKFGETPASERSMLMPQASMEMMADEGLIDGDQRFNEVMQRMGRSSFVDNAKRSMSPKSKSSGNLLHALEKSKSFGTLPRQESGDVEEESDDGDEVDDQPTGIDEQADGTGDPVIAVGDGTSAPGGGIVGEASAGRPGSMHSNWGS